MVGVSDFSRDTIQDEIVIKTDVQAPVDVRELQNLTM